MSDATGTSVKEETGPGTWPAEFPGAEQNIPRDVLNSLATKLLKHQIGLQGGTGGLFKFLYRGTTRPDGTMVGYLESPEQIWRYVLADAAEWMAARKAKDTPSPVAAWNRRALPDVLPWAEQPITDAMCLAAINERAKHLAPPTTLDDWREILAAALHSPPGDAPDYPESRSVSRE